MIVAALAIAAATITYSKDIAPLVTDRCAMCHHAGGSAPFALETYDDVKRHASQIVKVTASRFMPPWKADPIDGPFVGQHPLTDIEISTIRQWVDAGAPAGDARNVPPPRQWPDGWQLGKPDLVVTLPEPYTLQAFVVVILGGLGRVSATVVGGLLFGMIEVFAQSIPGSGSVYANAIALGLLVLVLVTRPQGLLGRRP